MRLGRIAQFKTRRQEFIEAAIDFGIEPELAEQLANEKAKVSERPAKILKFTKEVKSK